MNLISRISKSALLGLLSLCVLASGCGSSFRPKAALPAGTFSTPFLADLSSPTLFSDYNALVDGPAKVALRNQIIFEEMWLTDQSYDNFESGFFTGQGTISFLSTTTAMLLDMTGAVTGTASLKAILAATSGAVTGIQGNYQKEFFNQVMRTQMVQTMRANRLTERAIIEAGMATCSTGTICNSSVAGYSLETGLQDVSAYYDAGTIIGAIIAVSEASTAQSNAAKAMLKGIRRQQ